MNISQLKSRYTGIQTKLSKIGSDGCLFLCLCSIIEEVTGNPCDIIGMVQECMAKNWLLNDFTVNDSLAILKAYTGKSFRRVEVNKLPEIIRDNEFTVEKWFNLRTGYTHFKRRFTDTLASSVTVKEGSIKEYYIYSY